MTGVANPSCGTGEKSGFVSVTIQGQVLGVPVLRVRDVIMGGRIDPVPLAPPEVHGSLNLRGRIVTAVDIRTRLGVTPRAPEDRFMSVIVEHANELYALLVDDVGDVLWLSEDQRENTPVTAPARWRELTDGLYRLEDQLLLAISIDAVLRLSNTLPVAA